jgi:hypothetical protein
VNEDLEKFAEGDGAADSCERASYQNNGIIHLRVAFAGRMDVRIALRECLCPSRIAFRR